MSSVDTIKWEGELSLDYRLCDDGYSERFDTFDVERRVFAIADTESVMTCDVVNGDSAIVALVRDRTRNRYLVCRSYGTATEEVSVYLPTTDVTCNGPFIEKLTVDVLVAIEILTGYVVIDDYDNDNDDIDNVSSELVACLNTDHNSINRRVYLVSIDCDSLVRSYGILGDIQCAWVPFYQLNSWTNDGTITDIASYSLIKAIADRQSSEKLSQFE